MKNPTSQRVLGALREVARTVYIHEQRPIFGTLYSCYDEIYRVTCLGSCIRNLCEDTGHRVLFDFGGNCPFISDN